MSKILKLVIVTLIFILLSTAVFTLFFFNIFKIDKLDFINTIQQKRFTDDLYDISALIDNHLDETDKTTINNYIEQIDFSKFEDKKKSKNYDVAKEISDGKDLIFEEISLVKIKFYDNCL